jgi:hypothetical protein
MDSIMAANVVVNPADIVRDALDVVGMSNIGNINTRQTTRFMNANQLDDMDDFKYIDVSHVKEMVKQYQKAPGSTALGIRVQNNLQGLIWLARDKGRQGLTIDVANLNEDILYTKIFNVRITDSDAATHRTVEVSKLLARQEKEKKSKYLQSCHEMGKDFTPLVYTVDGVAGREARTAEKRLAALLADKWKRPYSQMVYYVKVRMQLSLVRTTSLLIRGSRNHQGHCWRIPPNGAAMSDWQAWQERD